MTLGPAQPSNRSVTQVRHVKDDVLGSGSQLPQQLIEGTASVGSDDRRLTGDRVRTHPP
jgi:hypothetical protein